MRFSSRAVGATHQASGPTGGTAVTLTAKLGNTQASRKDERQGRTGRQYCLAYGSANAGATGSVPHSPASLRPVPLPSPSGAPSTSQLPRRLGGFTHFPASHYTAFRIKSTQNSGASPCPSCSSGLRSLAGREEQPRSKEHIRVGPGKDFTLGG